MSHEKVNETIRELEATKKRIDETIEALKLHFPRTADNTTFRYLKKGDFFSIGKTPAHSIYMATSSSNKDKDAVEWGVTTKGTLIQFKPTDSVYYRTAQEFIEQLIEKQS